MKSNRSRSPLDRKAVDAFWARVQKGEGCWIWIGARFRNGYGQVSTKREGIIYAHRMSFRIHSGAHPGAAMVCHHCDNPSCVRPDHLFLGDAKTNHMDMRSKGRMKLNPHAAKNLRCHVPAAQCPSGHELSRENTGTILRNGRHAGRYCRQCKRQQKRLARGWPAHEALAGGLGHRFRPRPHLESAQERGRVGRVHSLAPHLAWQRGARGEGRDEEG